ncbi:hypothetical protein AKJ09_06492 [Labilithrix luteola]|uniref:Uncharacterized protein n=1 Tax=Labilithrix luteola TaxID=1391654 RepID=A0A0K1Q217_9BACT|nr:hypothetical protein [Labilithrix luteola]AKU99828.1 hypothetical protein AKJ09_06492 [Labilithrix luteola]
MGSIAFDARHRPFSFCRVAAGLTFAAFGIVSCGQVEESATPALDGSWVAESLPPDTSRRDVTTPASCTGLPGTDEELALTPRADEEAEALALLVDGTFTATSASYERIRRDLAAIRAHEPELSSVRGQKFVPVVSLTVDDASTIEAMESGAYHAWDCLHARYGWDKPTFSHYSQGWQSASGWLNGRYAPKMMRALYEQLPSIRRANSGAGGLDGPRVCATREADDVFHYVFDDASGDCPSGCMHHHEYYFVSTTDGRITRKGEFETGPDAIHPDWVLAYGMANCR